jgi:hypothetical protein
MAFTRDYDPTRPADTDSANLGDDEMRFIRVDIADRLASLFYGFTPGENTLAANCKQLTLGEQASIALPDANMGILACLEVGGKCELHWKDEDANQKQITTAGLLNIVSAELLGKLANDTYLTAIDEAGTGTVDLIKAAKNEADDTEVVLLPDLTRLASDAAPTEDSQIANKAYVDVTPHVGGIVQIVNTQTGAVATMTTLIPSDDTIPQITEGTQVLSATITPKSAANKLKIDVVLYTQESTGGNTVITGALFQDATANALAAGFSQNGTTYNDPPIVFTHYMDAGGVAATTFTVRVGPQASATVTLNGSGGVRMFGGVLRSSITITEIKV